MGALERAERGEDVTEKGMVPMSGGGGVPNMETWPWEECQDQGKNGRKKNIVNN